MVFLPTTLSPLTRGIGVSFYRIEPSKQDYEDLDEHFHSAPYDGPSLPFSQPEMAVSAGWVTRPTDVIISPAFELGYDPVCVAKPAVHHTPIREPRQAHVQTQNGTRKCILAS